MKVKIINPGQTFSSTSVWTRRIGFSEDQVIEIYDEEDFQVQKEWLGKTATVVKTLKTEYEFGTIYALDTGRGIVLATEDAFEIIKPCIQL